MNANAYTVGHDVFFGAGQYAPETETGLGLLAHELTHVVQQSRGGERVQFDRGVDDVARSFVEEGLSPHDVARRLASSHMSQRDRRPLIRSYYTQYYRTWMGRAPGPEMLAKQVAWIDRMVRERKARRERERRERMARQERERRQQARLRAFIDYWGGISPVERYLVIQNELEVGERVDSVKRLYAFISWCTDLEVRGTVDDCLCCETTEEYFSPLQLISREREECHFFYDHGASFFFRDEAELRTAEDRFRGRVERRRRRTGIPQEEFARRGRRMKAEFHLGVIQNTLLGVVEGPGKVAVEGWSLVNSAKDAYECVHRGDEESCAKSVQSFLSKFSKGMLSR
jgi:hypothetical protein